MLQYFRAPHFRTEARVGRAEISITHNPQSYFLAITYLFGPNCKRGATNYANNLKPRCLATWRAISPKRAVVIICLTDDPTRVVLFVEPQTVLRVLLCILAVSTSSTESFEQGLWRMEHLDRCVFGTMTGPPKPERIRP